MLKNLSLSTNKLVNLLRPESWIKNQLLKLPFNQIQKGSLTLTLYGESIRFEGKQAGPHAELSIINPLKTYWLLQSQGELGFAQAYYENAIDTVNLKNLMLLAYANEQVFAPLLDNKIFNLKQLWQHRKRHNSLKNSRKNISFHYDLGNDFYGLWLDKDYSYSSGLFLTESDDLSQSQTNKYQRLFQKLDLMPHDKLLEIGCGWGGMMQMALENHVHVKGLTLSKEQQRYAENRLKDLTTTASYEVALQDYRAETQQYDAIVSIEMFEAVGKEYWHTYFNKLNSSLKQYGKAAIQVITIDEQHADKYQNSVDFIQTYIFPGGLLPSVHQFKQLALNHGFMTKDVFDFGLDYATTCEIWKNQFNQHSQELTEMGYDKNFQRLWNYYLDYCIVGFETKHISVHQIVLEKIIEVER